MEAFKAVEKEMKTKAFSKEGLLVTAKLDPKEREKEEMNTFLNDMKENLQDQVDKSETERDQFQVQAKKSKKDASSKERVEEIEYRIERHKWHILHLEMLMRALENEAVEAEGVKDVQDDIRNYVENNEEVDFYEDESIYDAFGLEENASYGGPQDLELVTSQDNQSGQDEAGDSLLAVDSTKGKSKATPDGPTAPVRRPSQPIRSPLPTLATMNNMPAATAATVPNAMKPAPPPPSKPPGEALKYASAAAAAAASDTAGIGIAPLPPPPGRAAAAPIHAPAPSAPSVRSSATTSPAAASAQPVPAMANLDQKAATSSASATDRSGPSASAKSPAPSQSSINGPSPAVSAAQLVQASARDHGPTYPHQLGSLAREISTKSDGLQGQSHDRVPKNEASQLEEHDILTNQSNGLDHLDGEEDEEEDESVYHLPSSLQELVDCYKTIKDSAPAPTQPEHQRMLAASYSSRPDALDAEKPRHYKPENPAVYTPLHYPQEPLPIFDDPRLYNKVDHDALFYSFYYRQGTYQQYLAAKTLKQQSWRFHKRYQTWFQRHEEPKMIEEEYEQGTYRFFDYESTW